MPRVVRCIEAYSAGVAENLSGTSNRPRRDRLVLPRSGGRERPDAGLELDPLGALGRLDVAGDADVVGGCRGQRVLAASMAALAGRLVSTAELGTVDLVVR